MILRSTRILLVGVVLAALCALTGCGNGSSGGTDSVEGPPTATVEFHASPNYGEAPFKTVLSWEIESDRAGELSCQLDMEGDGTVEESMDVCPVAGSKEWTYEDWGEYRPLITVTSSSGEVVAKQELRVFSNELILTDEVEQLDEIESYGGFEVEGDTVTLHFAGGEAAGIETGAVLLSKKEGGLLVRVVSVVETREDATVVQVEAVGLDEIIKEGFWGMMPTAPANGETRRAALRLDGKADLLDVDEELSTPVVSFSPPVPDVKAEAGAGNIALTDIEVEGNAQAGINAFILKKGLFSPLSYDISVWAAADWELGATIVGGVDKSWRHALPEVPLGIVLVGPVPITFDLEPALFGEVGLDGSLVAGASGEVYVMGGAHNLSGKMEPYGDVDFDSEFSLDPAGAVATGSAKAGLSVRLKIQVASMLGPFAEAGGYGKAQVSVKPDEYCIDAFLGIEGTVGGEFEFFKVVDVELSYPFDIADWPLWSDCYSLECVPDCSGLECGPDPVCGESCGTCGGGDSCQAGQCVQGGPDCPTDKDCSGLECGADPVCGESCGTCGGAENCQAGKCTGGSCWPDCGEEVLIPAGKFWMGCNEAVDDDCHSGEYPYHEVYLDAYYIDVTEVTQAAFKECVDAGVCDTPENEWAPAGTPDHPVVGIDWFDAKAYCEWAGKRLPTEAEWEKAARGTDGRKYPWGNEEPTCDLAVKSGCPGDAQPVCSVSPAGDSPYGLCDMAGNVWEWVADWYDHDYYENSPANNPTGPNSGSGRVIRGGSFVDFYDYGVVYYLRVSNRGYDDPSDDSYPLGCRCARPE